MPTQKILLMMKRRPGMSVADFRDYYENRHAPLATKRAAGMTRYVRRYLDPHPHPETGAMAEPPFDVITELWFEDDATYRRTLAYVTTHNMPPEIVEDERKLFDRTSFRICTTVEHDTDFGS
ncbi:EthD domain-containing protein [Croceicoccus hydrothermalis]|uniref:EthD domain-containing protein n=1 Tax=Croceicoccus hydrothermalis TaxID=2867964 RepID=UPI001EFBE41C|nr:EthD domain-containing protein [Croceicoccus hydrothermalis]